MVREQNLTQSHFGALGQVLDSWIQTSRQPVDGLCSSRSVYDQAACSFSVSAPSAVESLAEFHEPSSSNKFPKFDKLLVGSHGQEL